MNNQSIRYNTRLQLSGNYGQAILATIVPGLIFGVINFIIGLFIGQAFIPTLIVSFITTTLTTFMVTSMVLLLAKGYSDAEFGESLKPINVLAQVFIYTGVIYLITTAVQFPINMLFFGSWYPNAEALQSIMPDDPAQQLSFIFGYLGSILAVAILIFFITFKLIYTVYILIDREMAVMEAVKKSFKYTKGNFFRIVGMNFFFIGWYLLSIFTCGLLLFWVIPYHSVSQANLYLIIKEENGDPSGRYKKPVAKDLEFDALSEETLAEKPDPDDLWN